MLKGCLLIFIMVLSLTGCKNSNKKNVTTSDVSTSTTTTEGRTTENIATESTKEEHSIEIEEPTTVATSIVFDFDSISHCIVTNGTTGESVKLTSPELDDVTSIFSNKEWTLIESSPSTMGWNINIKFYTIDSTEPIYEIANLNDDNIVVNGDEEFHYYTCDDYYFDREWFDELTANEKFQY